MKKLLVVDGSSLLTTCYFANLPKEIKFAKTMEERQANYGKILQSHDGLYTNGMYGFLTTFFTLCKIVKPDSVAVCWDRSRNTFRRKSYPDYKANRRETDEPLKEQFKNMQLLLDFIGVKNFSSEEYEADDFAGSLGKTFFDCEVIYFTKDNDYLQLVSPNSKVWMVDPKATENYKLAGLDKPDGLPDNVFEFNEQTLPAMRGIIAEQVIEYKGLCGDTSDNIPGIVGIGPKTALSLLQTFGNIQNIYKAIDGLDEKGVQKVLKQNGIVRCPAKKLMEGKSSAEMSAELAKIKRDIPITCTLDELSYNIDMKHLRRILYRLDFQVDKFIQKHF